MKQENLAKQVREALGLTPTQAGQLLFGYEPKKAYDMWSRWERDNKLSLPTQKYLNVILFLIEARDLGAAGASQALNIYLKILSDKLD
jgi:hypothetical protein